MRLQNLYNLGIFFNFKYNRNCPSSYVFPFCFHLSLIVCSLSMCEFCPLDRGPLRGGQYFLLEFLIHFWLGWVFTDVQGFWFLWCYGLWASNCDGFSFLQSACAAS